MKSKDKIINEVMTHASKDIKNWPHKDKDGNLLVSPKDAVHLLIGSILKSDEFYRQLLENGFGMKCRSALPSKKYKNPKARKGQ